MLVMWTAEDPADPLGQLVSAQKTLGLDHFALAVDPFGLDGVKPRTLLGQKAAYDPHSFAAPFDKAVVRTEPAPDLFGDMPARVVPDQKQELLANSFELFATPLKESGRHSTDGPAIHKTQARLFELGHIQPVAGYSLRIGVVSSNRALAKANRFSLLGPATQGR